VFELKQCQVHGGTVRRLVYHNGAASGSFRHDENATPSGASNTTRIASNR
jgi:hypothetical protein